MSKIVLISCVSKKLKHKSKAQNLYISPLFKKNLEYAKSLDPDKIYILSAEYGLLDLNEEIEPYDKTLNRMKLNEIKAWADLVIKKLKNKTDLQNDEFIFLAGDKYRKYLIPHIKKYQVPMQGLSIGKQLRWLSQRGNNCNKIHQLYNRMKKFSFPFNNPEIPENGIYILFERGENAHNTSRIVRIGTHTGKNQLRSRLFQHFLNENKDRSIFRKNIGRAILNKKDDLFLKYWELDLTSKEAKKKYSNEIDFIKQKEVEKEVTKYIQENFSFVVFRVDDKKKRLDLESKIISTISHCKECKPSQTWLGNFSPIQKIKKGGLWLVNELWKKPLGDEEILELERIV